MQQAEAFHEEVVQLRREKDRYFSGPNSPLPRDERQGFRGLPYYAHDPAYVFEAELKEDEQPQKIQIQRTGGDVVTYDRVGTFTLKFPDGQATFAAYKSRPHETDLFIPFRDATTGKETYDVGRYLEATLLGDGKYLVDFNRAYNPFCAYNEHYTCPLVPKENHLTAAIRAGEKKPVHS